MCFRLLQWLLVLGLVGAQQDLGIAINGPTKPAYTFFQPMEFSAVMYELRTDQAFTIKWVSGALPAHLSLLRFTSVNDKIVNNTKELSNLDPMMNEFNFTPSTDLISSLPYVFRIGYRGGHTSSGLFLIVNFTDTTATEANLSNQTSTQALVTGASIEPDSAAPRESQTSIGAGTSQQWRPLDESTVWPNAGSTQSRTSLETQAISASAPTETSPESLNSVPATISTNSISSELLPSQVTDAPASLADLATTTLPFQSDTLDESPRSANFNLELAAFPPISSITPDTSLQDPTSGLSPSLSSTLSGNVDVQSATSTSWTPSPHSTFTSSESVDSGTGTTFTVTSASETAILDMAGSMSSHPSLMNAGTSVPQSPLPKSDAPVPSTTQYIESQQVKIIQSQATTTSILALSLSDPPTVWTPESPPASYMVSSASSSFLFPNSLPSPDSHSTLPLDQHNVPKFPNARIPELIPAVVVSFVTVATSLYITSTLLPLNTSTASSSQSSTSLGVKDPNIPLVILGIFAFLFLFGLILCFWLYLRMMKPQQYQPLPTAIQVTTSPSSDAPTDVLVELPPAYGMLHSDHIIQPAIPPLQEQRGTSSSSLRSSYAYPSSQIWELGLPSEQSPSLRSAEHLTGQQSSSRRFPRRLSSASRRSIRKPGGLPIRRASYHLQVPNAALGGQGMDQIGRAASDRGTPTRRDL